MKKYGCKLYRAWLNCCYQEQEQNPPNLGTEICIPLSDTMSQKKPVMAVAPSGGTTTPNNRNESKDGWMMELTSLMRSIALLKSPVVSRKLRY